MLVLVLVWEGQSTLRYPRGMKWHSTTEARINMDQSCMGNRERTGRSLVALVMCNCQLSRVGESRSDCEDNDRLCFVPLVVWHPYVGVCCLDISYSGGVVYYLCWLGLLTILDMVAAYAICTARSSHSTSNTKAPSPTHQYCSLTTTPT